MDLLFYLWWSFSFQEWFDKGDESIYVPGLTKKMEPFEFARVTILQAWKEKKNAEIAL
jgi:hypothetical protein